MVTTWSVFSMPSTSAFNPATPATITVAPVTNPCAAAVVTTVGKPTWELRAIAAMSTDRSGDTASNLAGADDTPDFQISRSDPASCTVTRKGNSASWYSVVSRMAVTSWVTEVVSTDVPPFKACVIAGTAAVSARVRPVLNTSIWVSSSPASGAQPTPVPRGTNSSAGTQDRSSLPPSDGNMVLYAMVFTSNSVASEVSRCASQ
mmetsp:Transcript_85539/g.228818  ORF Transcript_85539/g.228818 Transcript_85539/m.228818 type:complete len:204 (+) Transcript_85539:1668-2279(+)